MSARLLRPALLAALGLTLSCSRTQPSDFAIKGAQDRARQVDKIVHSFGQSSEPKDDSFQRKVSSAKFHNEVVAVAEMCLKGYHRDSCLHHLIECGQRCVMLIPKNKFVKIARDWKQLMTERKLARGPQ